MTNDNDLDDALRNNAPHPRLHDRDQHVRRVAVRDVASMLGIELEEYDVKALVRQIEVRMGAEYRNGEQAFERMMFRYFTLGDGPPGELREAARKFEERLLDQFRTGTIMSAAMDLRDRAQNSADPDYARAYNVVARSYENGNFEGPDAEALQGHLNRFKARTQLDVVYIFNKVLAEHQMHGNTVEIDMLLGWLDVFKKQCRLGLLGEEEERVVPQDDERPDAGAGADVEQLKGDKSTDFVIAAASAQVEYWKTKADALERGRLSVEDRGIQNRPRPVEDIENDMREDSIDRDIDQSRRAEGKPDLQALAKKAVEIEKNLDVDVMAGPANESAIPLNQIEAWLGQARSKRRSKKVEPTEGDPVFRMWLNRFVAAVVTLQRHHTQTCKANELIYDALSEALGSQDNANHQNGEDAVRTLAAQRDHALEKLERLRSVARACDESDDVSPLDILVIIGE
jgi:hypothetical protein